MKVKDYRALMEAEEETSTTSPDTTDEAGGGDASMWRNALRVLMDETAGVAARQDALRSLGAGLFVGTEFAPFRPDFQRALRMVAENDNAPSELRRSALGALANMKDDTARRVLAKGLREPAAAAVPPAVALEMLSLDDHTAAAHFAREALDRSNNEAVRQQAVRILGADPSAKEVLRGILRNKDEFREVRRSGAVALRALEPDAFESDAAAILADPDDFSDIKATLDGVLKRSQGRILGSD